MDANTIKAANEAVYTFANTATKKTLEMQTTLFQDWLALNKKLWEMNPARELFSNFKQ